MRNVKLYVDFWNFQLSWNSAMSTAAQRVSLGWRQMPSSLMAELPTVFGPTEQFAYRGTHVFASVDPRPGSKDEGLKRFLHSLNQATGYQVVVKDRKPKKDHCPHCNKDIDRMVEKGVDASIVTALYEGAINDAYDIALLFSNDADHIPAIKTIQDRLNKQIVHIGFKTGGSAVRSAAWSHVLLDGEIAKRLIEGGTSAPA
jgi:NYN domain